LNGSDLTCDDPAASVRGRIAPTLLAEEAEMWEVSWQATRADLLEEGQRAASTKVSYTSYTRSQGLAFEPRQIPRQCAIG
jgi:hypothetical protein